MCTWCPSRREVTGKVGPKSIQRVGLGDRCTCDSGQGLRVGAGQSLNGSSWASGQRLWEEASGEAGQDC